MYKLKLTMPERNVLHAWLAEAPWIAPDDCLLETIALRDTILAHYLSDAIPLERGDLLLLEAFLSSLWDRPSATSDLPIIEAIEDTIADLIN